MARRHASAATHRTALAARVARGLARSPWGAALGRGAYELAARAAARTLIRDPCVEGVYLTGSVATGTPDPGFSDIDLVLVVELEGPEQELRFRRRLRSWLDGANRLGPVFAAIDYLEPGELARARTEGDAWSLGLDARWRCLAGRSRLGDVVTRPRRARRLLRLAKVLARWVKLSGFVLGGHDAGPARTARRVLEDALRADADRARADDAAPLLARDLDPEVRAWGRSSDPATVLAAAARVLGRMAREVSARWTRDATVEGRLAPTGWPPPPRASHRVMAHALAPSRDVASEERLLVVVSREGCSEREAAQALQGPWPAIDTWALPPVWLTPAMLDAVSALEIAPVAGWSCAAEDAVLLGAPVRVRAPSEEDLGTLVRAGLATVRARARGRMLRARTAPAQGLVRMRRDLALWQPTLRALEAGEPLRFAPRPASEASEAELIAALHEAGR